MKRQAVFERVVKVGFVCVVCVLEEERIISSIEAKRSISYSSSNRCSSRCLLDTIHVLKSLEGRSTVYSSEGPFEKVL